MLTSDINATIRNGNITEEIIIMFSRFKPLLLISRQNRFWFFSAHKRVAEAHIPG